MPTNGKHDIKSQEDTQEISFGKTFVTNSKITPQPKLTPELRDILALFPKGIQAQDVQSIPLTLELIRNYPYDVTHGEPRQELMKAIRIIEKVLPGLIEDAEARNKNLAVERAINFSLFVHHMRNLQAAAEPFFDTAKIRRDERGWWHGWARILALEVRRAFDRVGKPVSFSNETAPALDIVVKLLKKAGEPQKPSAVIDALRARKRLGK